MSYEFADRLIEMRRSRGLSQEELANNLGLSRQAISKWERAESAPDIGNLVALANIYDVTLDELVRGIDGVEEVSSEVEVISDGEGSEIVIEEDAIVVDAAKGASADSAEVVVEELAAVSANESIGEEGIRDAAVEIVDDEGSKAVASAVVEERATSSNAVPKGDENVASGSAKEASFPPPNAVNDQVSDASREASFPPPNAGDVVSSSVPNGGIPVQPPVTAQTSRAKSRNPLYTFPYALLVALVYLVLGFVFGLWHPGWVIFLTIPFYYWIASVITHDPEFEEKHTQMYHPPEDRPQD